MEQLATSERVTTDAANARPEIPGSRRLAIAAWASTLVVALLIWVVEASLAPELAERHARSESDWRHFAPELFGPGEFLLLTMTANAAILAWAIWLDAQMKTACRANRSTRAHDERALLTFPAMLSAGAVTVWANSLALRAGLADALPITIVVVLPTVAMTAVLMWRSVLALACPAARAGLLCGYVLIVAALERWFGGGLPSRSEDWLFPGNSLLIGLAVSVRLAVWCATESPSISQSLFENSPGEGTGPTGGRVFRQNL